MKACTLATLLLLGFIGGARADAAREGYMGMLRDAEAQTGPVEAFSDFDSLDPTARAALGKRAGTLQWLATVRSLTGDANGAAQAWSWWRRFYPPGERDQAGAKVLPSTTAEDALTAILAQARDKQVVILNEAHLIPLSRVFASRLAHELRKLGYEYMACETFDSDTPTPLTRGYVNRHAGFYSQEPMYGELLHTAIRDGWAFIGYDSNENAPESMDAKAAFRWRDERAVDKLQQRIFAGNPKAKVFIYVGFAHAIERPAPNDATGLAYLIKTRLGIDPLTIDQSTMVAYPDRAAENPLYRTALVRSTTSQAFVLRSNMGYEAFGRYRHGVDMQVIHPDLIQVDAGGRPGWMAAIAGLRPHPVPADLMPATGRRLIQAFHAEDPADAVPADMVMVEAGQAPPKLMLAEGKYRFTYED